MPLVVDTGVLYALADADDAWHARCLGLIENSGEILLAPVTVLPEVAYLLGSRLGIEAERRFVAAIVAGELAVDYLGPADLARAAEILARHPDIGLVDATVAALAERLKQARLATTDRRHFAGIRPRHRPRFELVP